MMNNNHKQKVFVPVIHLIPLKTETLCTLMSKTKKTFSKRFNELDIAINLQNEPLSCRSSTAFQISKPNSNFCHSWIWFKSSKMSTTHFFIYNLKYLNDDNNEETKLTIFPSASMLKTPNQLQSVHCENLSNESILFSIISIRKS